MQIIANICKICQYLSIMQIIFRICCQERAFQVSLSRVRTVLETHLSFNGTRLVGRFVLSMGGKICIFSSGQDSGTILIFSSQLIASPQWFLLTRLPTMLTSPEIQFGPFTWCLEATPQGVDEDRLVVGEELSEESSLKMILISMLMMIIVLFKLSFLIYI